MIAMIYIYFQTHSEQFGKNVNVCSSLIDQEIESIN